MVELRDIEKIRETKKQSSYSFGFVLMISLLSFIFGVLAGVYFSDVLKEIFRIPNLSQ